MTDSRPSLDQLRARHAWNAIERAGKLPKRSEYSREAKRLPIRIKTSGLGQAVAFLYAKSNGQKDDPRTVLLSDLGDWLLSQRGLGNTGTIHFPRNPIIEAIVGGDARFLRLATDEAIHYLQWLTRFAEAEIPSEDE